MYGESRSRAFVPTVDGDVDSKGDSLCSFRGRQPNVAVRGRRGEGGPRGQRRSVRERASEGESVDAREFGYQRQKRREGEPAEPL